MEDFYRFKLAVEREMLFEPVCDIDTSMESAPAGLDVTASVIMNDYVDEYSGIPIETTRDGDCLFNAISLQLNGTDKPSMKLRYLTCLNLVNNYTQYNSYPQNSRIRWLSPTYVENCYETARIGAYSCAWTNLGLCDVIKCPIRVIYPPCNGKKELAYETLNTVFEPCIETTNDTPLSVIWYGIGTLPTPGISYRVNHFAAVFVVMEKSTGRSQNRPVPVAMDKDVQSARKTMPTASKTFTTPVGRSDRLRRKRVPYTPDQDTSEVKLKSEMRSFKSNENIHKKEGGSYYAVSANKASSVTL